MSETIKVLPPRARKPSLKRRLQEQSDEEEAAPTKRSSSGTKAKRLRTHSEEATTPVDGSANDLDTKSVLSPKEDMDVDIEGDMPSGSQRTETSAQSTTTPSSSRIAHSTVEPSNSTGRVKRKATKRAVVSSDEDSADEYDDATNDNPPTEKDKDDDVEWDAPVKSKSKQKEKEKEPTSAGGVVVKGKGILSTKIPKKRSAKDDKPLIVNFRDESKSSTSALASPSVESSDAPNKSAGSAKSGAAAKKKLPPITKKKASADTSSQPAHGDPNIFGLNGFKAKRFCEKQGHADVDLSNSSLYAELFKGTNSTKATNARLEARRKELNRMRDEARIKRQASLANPFDLQASLEKIAKFEDRWRVANRPIYYPSCLAGALFERRPPPVEGASS